MTGVSSEEARGPAVVRVAMGQMLVRGGFPEENLARAIEVVIAAGKAGAEVVVLPECLDLGWAHPSAVELALPLPGPRSDELAAAAKDAGVFLAAGLVERAGTRLYNAAVLFSPLGELLAKHRKVNILVGVEDIYSVGDRLQVVETSLGRVALTICADNFPTSLALGHSLARMGAQLILSPSSWAVDADHDNEREPYGRLWHGAYSELARLYGVAVVGVSNVGWVEAGPWQGKKCIGCSLAMGPGGKVLARGPYGEDAQDIVIVDVALLEPRAKGTGIEDMLRDKGYAGRI